MRKALLLCVLVTFASSVLAAPALKPKPSLQVARKALSAAGPAATDEQVAAAYPRFMLHPQNPPTPWFVVSTDDGCLYYDNEPTYGSTAEVVAGYIHDHFHVRWTGSPCTPGQFISGQGTLSWGSANTRNTVGGKRDDDYDSLTGTMVNGVFNGTVQRVYSMDEAQTKLIGRPQTFEMFGGCSNLDPKMVAGGFQMCQPRVP